MKPLEGIRILSLEQFGAAPYGAMFLADMGAEVIKIENQAIGGDPARHTGPHLLGPDDSLYFQTWGSNKRSVSLDLKTPEGRKAFEQLAATADAVIDNLRGDLPEKMKLDYKSLAHLNPALVCLHISAYGRDNERASRPGYDFLMQAEAGLMDLTGDPEGAPARFGPSIIDYMTGTTGMVGLLGCLLRARATGQGCDVDTCLFDVALHQLGYAATWYLNEKHVSKRLPRSAHFSVAPVQTFPTADGWIFIMCMTDKFWEALLDALSRTDLQRDPRFATPGERARHREELTDILDAEFRRQPSEHWLSTLGSVLPIAPVLNLEQALNNPFVKQTGMVRDVPHPRKPDMKLLASPLKFDGKRPDQVACSALGADNDLLAAAAKPGVRAMGNPR
jgi:crotonobetainyl-CoA:carnitine CoA-transferase CaiB-like acyl-CoA transferase